MKKIITLVAMLLIAISVYPIATAAGTNVTVKIDGKVISFPDGKPFIDKNSRTQVPVRFVSEALTAKVNWEENSKTVSIDLKGKKILLKVGESKATVDGKEKKFDTTSLIKDSRTYVPLRFVSETLGTHVEWVAATRTVEIYTVEYQKNGYTIPVQHGSTIDDNDHPQAEINLGVSYTHPDKNSIEKQQQEIQKVIESKFGKEFANQVMEYIKQKKDDSTGFEDKTFTISGQNVWVTGGIGSWTARVVVYKKGV